MKLWFLVLWIVSAQGFLVTKTPYNPGSGRDIPAFKSWRASQSQDFSRRAALGFLLASSAPAFAVGPFDSAQIGWGDAKKA